MAAKTFPTCHLMLHNSVRVSHLHDFLRSSCGYLRPSALWGGGKARYETCCISAPRANHLCGHLSGRHVYQLRRLEASW